MSWRYRFEYFPGAGQTAAGLVVVPWFVRLRSDNGEILVVSEAYTRKWSARRAARRMGRAFGVPVVEADG
jgi:hypothetical protein